MAFRSTAAAAEDARGLGEYTWFLPLTAVLATLVALVNAIEATAAGKGLVANCCLVYTNQPFPSLLARLPGSVLAAAPNLPVWGAILQVLVVIGVSEAVFGARRTLAVGLICHSVATLGGHVLWHTSQGAHGVVLAATRDTGPSVFVLGIAIYLLRAKFMRGLSILVMVGIVALAAGWSDLAGGEHVLGALTGWALAEVARRQTSLGNPGVSVAQRIYAFVPHDRRSIRSTAVSLGVGILCAALWHSYHPLAAGAATVNSGRGITAIAFTNRAALPVRVEGVEVKLRYRDAKETHGWWSAKPTCEHPSRPSHRWVWRRRVWWCLPLTSNEIRPHEHLRLDYWIVGVRESVEIR